MLAKWLKFETSKKLLWIVTTLFILDFIFTNIASLLWDKDLTFIFQYIFYSFDVCLVAYLGKAGFENVKKISVSDLFKSKDSVITNITETTTTEG